MASIKWTRKAVKRGGSLMVTIPKELSEAFKISDGDDVVLESADNHVLLSKEGVRPRRWPDDLLVENLPDLETYCLGKDSNRVAEACVISTEIREFRKEDIAIHPNKWEELLWKIDFGSDDVKIRVDFVRKLKGYLKLMEKDYGWIPNKPKKLHSP